MNNNINLTDSTVIDLNIEQGKTLDKTIQCLVKSGNTTGLFDFSPYTASTLIVKRKPNDFYTVLSFSTVDNSIVLDNDKFTLSKTNQETSLKSGQFYYEMTLTNSGGTFGFLRGKFFIVDESYGEISNDSCNTIYLQPSGVIWTGTTNNYYINTGSTGGGSIYYTGLTPSVISLGGINAGSTLTGRTFTDLFQALLVPTLYPTLTAPFISSFSQNLSTTQEVGVSITPTFTTNFNRGSISPSYSTSGFRSGLPTKYVYSGSGNIRTVSSSSTSNTSAAITPTTLVAGNNTWSVYVAHSVGEQPKDSSGNNYNTPLASGQTAIASTSITGLYPYFFGKSSTLPTANNALVNSGTKVVQNSNGTINITFNASAEYLWFAIPSTSTSKTVWYQSALNNGAIGGNANLFGDLSNVSVTTVLWAGISYKVYISNYQTSTSGVMELRNS